MGLYLITFIKKSSHLWGLF